MKKYQSPTVPVLIIVLLLSGTYGCTGALWALTFRGRPPQVNNEIFMLDQEVVVSEKISINHKDSTGGTDFFVTVSSGQSGSFTDRYMINPNTGSRMYYQIYDNTVSRTVLRDLSTNPDESQVLYGTFTDDEATTGGGTTKDLTFAVVLDPNQFPLAGQYSDEVRLELWAGSPGNPQPGGPVDTVAMPITAQMEPVLEMSLVPSGSGFDVGRTALSLDFGELYAGSVRRADLLVRANSTYTVYMRSENSGVMTIQDTSDESVVPYLLHADGSPVAVSSGTEQPAVPVGGPSSENGDRYDIRVEIGEYGMATEGFYTDILTITVAAQ